MQFTDVVYDNAQPVDGYGPGFFRIGGVVYEGPLLVLPTSVTSWGGYDDLAPLLALAGKLDVLFIGTGAETVHVPKAFRGALEAAEIGIEAMGSPMVCRTYNVLVGEGRRVGMALLPV